jgi:transposase
MASIAIRIGANRSQGAELSAEQRTAIIYALENRLSSQAKLAKEFGCHRNTIANTFKRWQERNDTKSRPRSGRPPKFNRRSRRLIKTHARRYPFWSYRALASRVTGTPSTDTIRRILKRSGIVRRLAKRKIPIGKVLAFKRKSFARRWRSEFYSPAIRNWIFSDECSVQRTSNNGPLWCWRLTSEAYRVDLVNPKVHVKDISQMVWAAIWLGGRSKLVVMERDESSERGGYSRWSYIKALEEGLLEIYQPGMIFQQDNAKIHIAKDTQNWFEEHGIYVEDWPAHSPDLNPIEPVWNMLKRQLFRMFPDLMQMGRSEEDWAYFKECISAAWDALDQAKIDALILSMGRRMDKLYANQGYYTKY